MTPIDLRSLADGKYQLETDPSAELETSREERRWLVRIACKRGFIAVYGPGRLLAYCHIPSSFPGLLGVPTVEVRQRGDAEFSATFHPDHLDDVARVLGARRKRRLSPAARAAATARLAAARFTPHSEGG